jgi:hypothetical protein
MNYKNENNATIKQFQGGIKMEKGSKILVSLLVVSIILNLYSLSGMKNLKQELQNQYYNVRNSEYKLSNLENSLSNINNRINEIHKESKWVTNEEFTANEGSSTKDEIHLNLEWSFKEIERGAEVYLLYSIQNSENWTRVKANNVGDGIFRAPFILEPKHEYRYKVAAQGTAVRTSEIKSIPSKHYRPSPVVIGGMGTSGGHERESLKNMSLDAYQIEAVLFDFFKPVRVQVKVYQGEKLDRVVDLRLMGDPAYPNRGWVLENLDFEKSPTSVVLEVEYGDGSIDSGEIWPENKYNYIISKYQSYR